MIASNPVVYLLKIFAKMSVYFSLSFIIGKINQLRITDIKNNRPILYQLFSPVQIHKCRQKGSFSRNRFLSIMTLLTVMFLKLFIPMELNYVYHLVQTSTNCAL